MILTGDQIRIKRTINKITQKDLANKIKVTNAHLCEVEKERTDGLKARVAATEFFAKLESEKKSI